MFYKDKNLQDIFRTKLYSALVLPIALLIILFSGVYIFQLNSTIHQEENYVKKQFFNFFQDHVNNQSKHMEEKLNSIEYSLLGVDTVIENYYSNDFVSNNNKPFEFEKNSKGFFYKPDRFKGSSVVFTPQAKPNDKDIIDAYNLEKVDPYIMPVVNNNDIVIAAWINLENYLVRYYPYFDMKNILLSDMDLKEFNFYYEANIDNNPYKQNIWTTPYLDPAMQGWLISRVAPIYKEEKFIGVFGYDVSIDKLVENIKNALPSSQKPSVFITSEKGDILSIDSKFMRYVGLKPLKEYYNNDSLSQEVLLPDLYNIYKTSNHAIKDKLALIYENNTYTKIEHNGETKYIFKGKVDNLKWNIFYVVDEESLLDEMKDIQDNNYKIVIFTLFLFLVSLIAVILNLRKRLNNTISDIVKPIEELSEATKDVKNFNILPKQKIYEISVLYKNFTEMAKRIVLHQEELEKKVYEATSELTQKVKTIEKLQDKLIDQNNHDYLTKLCSKRYGAKSLKREVEKSIEQNLQLTVVMIDIDNFKSVNDILGHEVGDQVLDKLGSIVLKNIGDRNIPVRYGGEEFLLIFPNYSVEETIKVVEKIREQYHNEISMMISIDKGITLSAGISSLPENTTNSKELVIFADNALYEAKNTGKDKIVVYKSALN